ncbi:transmembrane protein, putative, partial [Rhizoctonia solani AG-3 Rhs1AP]
MISQKDFIEILVFPDAPLAPPCQLQKQGKIHVPAGRLATLSAKHENNPESPSEPPSPERTTTPCVFSRRNKQARARSLTASPNTSPAPRSRSPTPPPSNHMHKRPRSPSPQPGQSKRCGASSTKAKKLPPHPYDTTLPEESEQEEPRRPARRPKMKAVPKPREEPLEEEPEQPDEHELPQPRNTRKRSAPKQPPPSQEEDNELPPLPPSLIPPSNPKAMVTPNWPQVDKPDAGSLQAGSSIELDQGWVVDQSSKFLPAVYLAFNFHNFVVSVLPIYLLFSKLLA